MVYESVRAGIIEGEFVAGAPLRQDELAGRFGVSRIPVREALRRLEAEGLMPFHANRGAVVVAVSLAEALEMLEIRIALECHALRLAIANMTETDFARIERAHRAYAGADDVASWGEFNRDFHLALYAPADRPRLMALIADNFDRAGRFARLQVAMATGKQRPIREHREILRACRVGDADKAVLLLEAHILHSMKALQAAVRSGGLGSGSRSDVA